MRLLWVNEIAGLTGGCERYVRDTAVLFRDHGVHSTLMYSVAADHDPAFTKAFDAAFPMVDIPSQLVDLKPDVVYIHRLSGIAPVHAFAQGPAPVARFFHDHRLFCTREHKYTARGRRTCTRTVGPGCLACHGGIVKDGGLRFVGPWTVLREQAANKGLAAFVVGSSYMAGHIAAHGFDRARTHVLPLYTTEPLPPADPPAREPDLALFVGQLGAMAKAFDTLLDALALCRKPVRLLVHGTGKFEEAYRTQAASLGLGNRVDFAGKADDAGLARAYARAGFLVFPSRGPETFGLVGPEAMSRSTAVIATMVGGTGEWLTPDRSGLAVPPNDPAALAQAMDRLAGEPELAARLGSSGRKDWEERFRPERHVRDLLALLRGLAGKGGGQ